MASEEHEKDVVYLYMFPRSVGRYYYPNLSAYVTKVEAWMRMRNIKHKVIETYKKSEQTDLLPYIRLNGEDIWDSQLIIERLTRHFGLDESEGLSVEQQAVSRAFQKMLDENTYWTYIIYRYVEQDDLFLQYSNFLTAKEDRQKFKEKVKLKAWGHGIGRLTSEQIIDIGNRDITAVSGYLGDKQFFHGDKPTMIDCVIFGQLTQLTYCDMPYPQKAFIEENCKNLLPYFNRLRDCLYPDWDTLCPACPTDRK